MSKPLSVSIVTFKHDPFFMEKVLASVMSDYELVENIFLIDNSPNDDLKVLKSNFPLNYIHTGRNLGYGAAHNLAINETLESNVRFHLVINPDVSFGHGTLKSLVNFMEKDNSVALVMPKVLYPDGSFQNLAREIPSAFELICRRFLNRDFFHNDAVSQLCEEADRSWFIPFLSGCFMLMRVEALKKVGTFDERYFMYMEDLDLSRRLASVGNTVYFPSVVVYHDFQKGSYKSGKLLKYHIISAVKYFNKWGWFLDKDKNQLNSRVGFYRS